MKCSNLLNLPDEIIIDILQLLSWHDLVKCSLTCSKFNYLCQNNSLWKHITWYYWLENICPHGLSWYEYFYKLKKDWGKYMHCYKEIKTAWISIELFLKDNTTTIYDSLKPGLLEEDLERIENAIGYNLPLDFRCSYRIRNGQRLNAPGILGSMEIGTHYISEALLDLETLIQPAIWARSSLKGCLPVTVCVSTGVSQYMALSSEDGHIPGSLFYPVDDRRISNLSGDKDVFLTAINFQDWLTAHADKLKRSQYPIIKNEIYRFLPDPLNTTSTTNHIKVSVATCFCPELSSVNPPRFFYTYRITMTMDSNAPKNDMYRLSSRHWLITDSEGREERVDGPGIVGEYPLMFAGTTYSWVSCTTFKTRVGYMQGYFSMVKLNESNNFAHGFSINQLIENKNSVFKVTCPKFRMVCSLSITAGQRRVGITNLSIIGNTDNDGDSDMDDAIGFQYDYDDNN